MEIKEPTVQYCAFFDNRLLIEEDARGFFDHFERAARRLTGSAFDRGNIDQKVKEAQRQAEMFELVDSEEIDPQGRRFAGFLAYLYGDLLTVQVEYCDYEPKQKNPFQVPQDNLERALGKHLPQPMWRYFWGDTLVYWARLPEEAMGLDVQRQILSDKLKVDATESAATKMDFGTLWLLSDKLRRREYALFVRDTPECNRQAHQFLFFHSWDRPALLPMIEALSYKVRREWEEYKQFYQQLKEDEKRLNAKMDDIMSYQRKHQEDLKIVKSKASTQLLIDLASQSESYLNFHRDLSDVKVLRETIRVNLLNYQRVMSELPFSSSTHSGEPVNGIFMQEVRQGKLIEEQIAADLVHFEAAADKAKAAIDTIQTSLRLLERAQVQNEVRIQNLLTSLITTLMAAFATLEVIYQGFPGLAPSKVLAITLFIVLTTFAGCQVMINWRRERPKLDNVAVGVAGGWIPCGVLLFWFRTYLPLKWYSFLGTILAVWGSVGLICYKVFTQLEKRRWSRGEDEKNKS